MENDLNDIKEQLAQIAAGMTTLVTKEELNGISSQLSFLHQDLRGFRQEFAALEERLEFMRGFAKELDDLGDRLRVIEKQLGIKENIAA